MFSRREKIVLALMTAVHFCLIVDFMVVMPQGPQLMRLLEMSARQFGLLVSAYTLGAGVVTLAASVLVDRFERKRALVSVFGVFALCNAACAVVNTYEGLLAARFITGVFGGITGALLISVVSDAVALERRAQAIGLVMSAFAVASVLGVPLCLALANHGGWHAPFVFLTVATTLVCLAVRQWLPEMKAHLTGAPSPRFTELVGHPSRALALVFMAFLILGHFAVIPFMFPSVVVNGGIPETSLPVIYLVGGLASIAATVLAGKAADRFGHRRVFVICALLSLGAILAVTRLGPSSLWRATLTVTAFFVFMGGRLTPATAVVTSTALPRLRGGFMSIVGSVQQLAAAAAAFLAGQLVTKTPSGGLAGFENVGLFAVAFSAVAILLSFYIEPVERRG